MITAEIKEKIIHITIVGELSYEEFNAVVDPLTKSGQPYVGYLSDGREMTRYRSVKDQLRLAERHKQSDPEKRNAILMAQNGMSAIAKLYLRFTGDVNTRVFTNRKEALAWVHGG